ncbi:MAG TPA: recombinase family protein [Pseudolabrys sp.]|jgi:DNA invertase Pin-like site-specific DNA recombinase
MLYGYVAPSNYDPDSAHQRAALSSAGCSVIIEERESPKCRADRNELSNFLRTVQPGDALVVTRLDRVARSVEDLRNFMDSVDARGASLRVLEPSIDTASPSSAAFRAALNTLAVFEMTIRRERQLDGIAKAKEAGVYKGRKPTINREEIAELFRQGLPHSEISRRLGISRASTYRLYKTLAPETRPREKA